MTPSKKKVPEPHYAAQVSQRGEQERALAYGGGPSCPVSTMTFHCTETM